MREKTIVKLLINGKRIGESSFTNYEMALKYAKRKCEEGYKCLILRLIDDKQWARFVLEPSETM